MTRSLALSAWGIAASIALHLAAFALLTSVPERHVTPPLGSVVEFEVPPPEPVPAPVPVPEPVPEPESRPRLTPASNPAPAHQPEDAGPREVESPAEPAVADLTGLTLTHPSAGASWGTRVGNGNALGAPIRAQSGTGSTPRVTTRSSTPEPPKGPPLVGLADLSERPVPPRLDALLEQNYPGAARQQGRSGIAVVRLRIDADGVVRKARVLSESDAGFGSACHATVLGSRWSPPRDRLGKSVMTNVSYTCRFRAER